MGQVVNCDLVDQRIMYYLESKAFNAYNGLQLNSTLCGHYPSTHIECQILY